MPQIALAASIIAADFSRLEAHCREALEAGADWLHVDVMDGHFVPNITFGPLVVNALRPLRDAKKTVLDVHLMIEAPERYLADFARAGASRLTVHVEACPQLRRTIQAIRALGVRPGVTLNPATPLTAIEEFLPEVDLLLVMSVNPGFGGQSYIPSSTARLRMARQMLDRIGSKAWLEVDGGITPENIAEVVNAGATAIVAGTSVFGKPAPAAGKPAPVAENIAVLRRGFQK